MTVAGRTQCDNVVGVVDRGNHIETGIESGLVGIRGCLHQLGHAQQCVKFVDSQTNELCRWIIVMRQAYSGAGCAVRAIEH